MVQTSYYELSSSTTKIFSDIYFCFSKNVFNSEIKFGSQISNYVSVGYIHDYKFKRYYKSSQEIRKSYMIMEQKRLFLFLIKVLT